MLVAVFIISVALRAEAELKLRVCKLCPAADSAFMLSDLILTAVYGVESTAHIVIYGFFKGIPPVYLMGRKTGDIFRTQVEDQEIQERYNDNTLPVPGTLEELPEYQHSVKDGKILDLQGYEKIQHYLHIRIACRKGKEKGHIDVICGYPGGKTVAVAFRRIGKEPYPDKINYKGADQGK